MFESKKEPEVVVKTIYKVVEVKAPRLSQQWDKSTKDAVATLASHPGFIALVDRISWQKQMLESKCAHEFIKDFRDLAYMQAGVFWLGYLQDLVSKATALPKPTPVDPLDQELEAFRELDAAIERVGMDPQGSNQN